MPRLRLVQLRGAGWRSRSDLVALPARRIREKRNALPPWRSCPRSVDFAQLAIQRETAARPRPMTCCSGKPWEGHMNCAKFGASQRRLAMALALTFMLLALATPWAIAEKNYAPGITDTEI